VAVQYDVLTTIETDYNTIKHCTCIWYGTWNTEYMILSLAHLMYWKFISVQIWFRCENTWIIQQGIIQTMILSLAHLMYWKFIMAQIGFGCKKHMNHSTRVQINNVFLSPYVKYVIYVIFVLTSNLIGVSEYYPQNFHSMCSHVRSLMYINAHLKGG
jgi:hypothetical protein